MIHKKKEQIPITVKVINPEALPYARKVVTEYYYKKYLEMKRKETDNNVKI